ncbi:MAG: type I secretion system permease/ATPase [Beggiatoa sp. IS2]|nr:MAG: type I secretion system permease/ATPase [Beggiatoa sp. IS2]
MKTPPLSENFWQDQEVTATVIDPLLQCLMILTKLYYQPLSAAALTAGLPLVNNRLTPELFIRAAQRANLSAQMLERSLDQIAQWMLPAVLLFKDGQAALLLKYVNKKKVQMILANSGEIEISLKELKTNYSGNLLLVQPLYAFDTRTESPITAQPRFWFWGTLLKSWHLYSEVAVASLLINLFALASPLFIMNVYDRVVPNHAVETLWVLAMGAMIVFGFDFVIRNLRGYFIDVAGKRTDMLLSSKIFEQILAMQRAVYPRSVGALINHLHEFETFRDFLTSATLSTLIDLPFALLFIIIIWSLSENLAIIPLTAIPVVIIFALIIQFPLRSAIQASVRAGTQKQALLIETLTSMETLKTVRAEGIMQQRWEQLVGQTAQFGLKSRFLSALSVNFALFVQQITTIMVVIFGVYAIIAEKISMGTLIAITILTGRALAPLTQVVTLLTRYHQSLSALHTLDEVMKLPRERSTTQRFLQRPPLQGQVEFKQVDFNYPEQSVPTLKQISFKINAGERVGIIGRIGSGKSTLAKLIISLYQPHNGNVLLDGVDARQIDPADIRRNIGYTPQDGALFFGSVRDNIVIGAPYLDDSVVLKAAQIAGVDELVNQHPLGFDRPISERGENLSGGQKQAIILARTFLFDPPLLLLDEPTNFMDNRAEERFKARLLPYLSGKTLVLITHRMSLLSLVDRLIVVDQGQIVAQGPKEQVIQALTVSK